jgi:hypothetical protein
MSTVYHSTKTAIVFNQLDKGNWIVLHSPKTGKSMTMPCQRGYRTAVVQKALELMPTGGCLTINFSAKELKDYYDAWKQFRRSQ